MKICNIILFSFALLTIGCSKDESPDSSLESQLIGNWHVIEHSDSEGNTSAGTAFAFGLYCDAILLKEDKTFAIYYQSSEVDESKESGSWSVEESGLNLIHGTSSEIPTEIIEIESDFLTLRYSWLEGIVETIKLQRQ